jgi:hypothetical protein
MLVLLGNQEDRSDVALNCENFVKSPRPHSVFSAYPFLLASSGHYSMFVHFVLKLIFELKHTVKKHLSLKGFQGIIHMIASERIYLEVYWLHRGFVYFSGVVD